MLITFVCVQLPQLYPQISAESYLFKQCTMHSDNYITVTIPNTDEAPVVPASNVKGSQNNAPKDTVMTVPINSPEEVIFHALKRSCKLLHRLSRRQIATMKLRADGAVINPELLILALRGLPDTAFY
jgi:hypothetical protein